MEIPYGNKLKDERKIMKIPLEIGDIIYTGKFKNRKTEIEEIGYDEQGQPTINGTPMLKFKIEKLLPKKEKVIVKSTKQNK